MLVTGTGSKLLYLRFCVASFSTLSKKIMKVSFIAAIKNEEKYIFDCLNSVFNQIDFDLYESEVIVVDDNSSDSSFELLKRFQQGHPNLYVYRSKSFGKTAAYNQAFEHSTGDFISVFAGDDILPAYSLKLRMKSMLDFSKKNSLDWKTESICQYSKMKSFSSDKRYDGRILPPSYIKLGNESGATAFMTRSVWRKIHPIPASLKAGEGWMILCVKAFARCYHFPLVTYFYRIHLVIPSHLNAISYPIDSTSLTELMFMPNSYLNMVPALLLL